MTELAMTFVAAMKHYFNNTPSLFLGKPIEQTPSQFLREMKALTSADKDWYKAQLALWVIRLLTNLKVNELSH